MGSYSAQWTPSQTHLWAAGFTFKQHLLHWASWTLCNISNLRDSYLFSVHICFQDITRTCSWWRLRGWGCVFFKYKIINSYFWVDKFLEKFSNKLYESYWHIFALFGFHRIHLDSIHSSLFSDTCWDRDFFLICNIINIPWR